MNFWIILFLITEFSRISSALNISVLLSHKLVERFRGQLVAYYTFTDGLEASLSFNISHKLNASARLYLFAVGTQRTFVEGSPDSCMNFYHTSISNASLDDTHGTMKIGSFTGFFPTLLVFADENVCTNMGAAEHGESLVQIVLSNPGGQPLSGSLIGLSEHCIGLLSLYMLAILYTCHCIRLAASCPGIPLRMLNSGHSSSESCMEYDRSVSGVTAFSFACCSRRPFPGFLLCGRRFGHMDSHEKRLSLLSIILCVNITSLALFWVELHSLSHSTIQFGPLSQPWFGASGLFSHLGEMVALTGHFILATLLVFLTTDIILNSERSKSAQHIGLDHEHHISTHCSSVQRASYCTISVPALSVFRFGSPLLLHRGLWIMASIQVTWYMITVVLPSESPYAAPDRWPMEEQHSYWGGLGVTGSHYFPPTTFPWVDVGQSRERLQALHQLNTLFMTLFNSVSPITLLFVLVRTLLGALLSIRLFRASLARKPDRVGDLYARCGLLGLIWFLTHPIVAALGVLFADHIRYKITIVGITLVQALVCGSLVYLFTRQSVLWEISALSDYLPVLKRIPLSHSKI